MEPMNEIDDFEGLVRSKHTIGPPIGLSLDEYAKQLINLTHEAAADGHHLDDIFINAIVRLIDESKAA